MERNHSSPQAVEQAPRRLPCRGEELSSPQAVEQAPRRPPPAVERSYRRPKPWSEPPVASPAVERSYRCPKPWSKHPRRLPCRGEKLSSPQAVERLNQYTPALSEAESHSHPNVSNMYVPVTPSLHQEWLRLRAELTVAIDDAVEQGVRLREAMDGMQQVLEAHSTLEELQAAREELDWAEGWRDQTLEYACYIERKLELIQAMDCMVEACRHF